MSLAALLWAGCFAVTDFDQDQIETTRMETFTLSFQAGVDGFDILFVVDKTPELDPLLGGMASEADAMAMTGDGYTEMTDVDFGEGPSGSLGPSQMILNIGVVTSDLGAGSFGINGCQGAGDSGRLSVLDNCSSMANPGRWITTVDGIVTSPDDGQEMNTLLDCVVREQAQATGCRFKQPLAAVQAALDNVINSEFFRPNAGLAIVLMTNEDDCSAEDPGVFDPDDPSMGTLSTFRCFEHGVECDDPDIRAPGVKQNCREREGGHFFPTQVLAELIRQHKTPAPVIVTAVSGPPGPVTVGQIQGDPELLPSCDTGSMSAKPGIRIDTFLSQFSSENTRPETICQPDLRGVIEWLMERMASNLAYRCMPKAPADVDPETTGTQTNCSVEDVEQPGTVDEVRLPVSSCTESAGLLPCWEIIPAGVCQSGFRMEVRRSDSAPANSEVQVTCEVPIE